MLKKSLQVVKCVGVGVLLAATLLCASCNRDAAVESLMRDLNSLTNEIVTIIHANPTPIGVDQAQRVLNAKKADLKRRIAALKQTPSSQLSAGTMKKFEENVQKNGQKMAEALTLNRDKAQTDAEFFKGMQKLLGDFSSILDLP